VAERFDASQPWSAILSIRSSSGRTDLVANQHARYLEFDAPLSDLTAPGALRPMPSRQEMLAHAGGLRFIGWVRTARVGPFGLRPVLVMYSGSFVNR
jgi:hypothetical protein